jgi:hypothetical protein
VLQRTARGIVSQPSSVDPVSKQKMADLLSHAPTALRAAIISAIETRLRSPPETPRTNWMRKEGQRAARSLHTLRRATDLVADDGVACV